MKKLFIPIIVFFCSFSYSNNLKIIEVKASDKFERSIISNAGFAIDQVYSDKIFIFGSDSDAKKIKELGFEVNSTEIKEQWKPHIRGQAKYRSYNEVSARLKELATNHPNIASVFEIGKSHGNKPILMIRISGKSESQASTDKTPALFITGCHHAREHMSVEVPMRFAEHILSQYSSNPMIKKLVDSRELLITPIVNPDGYVHDYSGANGNGKWWRKNRRKNSNGTYGVDLNRNYGYGWGTGGSSSSPNSDVYMGPSPFSEPETKAVRDFLLKKDTVTSLISFHSFSELILYPWGGMDEAIGEKDGDAADLPVFKKMATDMSKWNNYKPQQSSDLYIASGDTTDWAYGELGIFAFTFELSPKSMWTGGFYPNASTIPSTFNANIKPMLYMLEFADDPSRVLTEPIPNFNNSPANFGVPIASFKDIVL